jgi:hypothetical protein
MSTVISADGTTIDYERYGAGPAVIFIGGATQYRGPSTAGIIPPLLDFLRS